MRNQVKNGVYDIYTNQMHYPKNMQPTHAKWEQLPDEPDLDGPNLAEGSPGPSGVSGSIIPAGTMGPSISPGSGNPSITATAELAPKHAATTDTPYDATKTYDPTVPPISHHQRVTYATVDTHMKFAPHAHLGPPRVDGGEFDLEPKGRGEVTDEVIACLPPECLGPFLEARELERKWRTEWGTEEQDGMRAKVHVTYTTPP